MTQAAQHLLALLDDVLDLSKIEAGRFTLSAVDFDPSEVAARACNLVAQRAHEKGLVLHQNVSGLPMLHGDALRLRQILLNYLSNAVKFTDKGRVCVSARLLEREHDTRLWVRFEVQDTGMGVAREQQGQLFHAFTQADASITRRYGGTGLGLAICQRLATLMGGRVGVLGEADQGSCFWAELPFEAARVQRALPAPDDAADAPNGTTADAWPDTAALRQRWDELRALLAQDDAQAAQLFGELRPVLQSMLPADLLQRLTGQMIAFAFDQALITLDEASLAMLALPVTRHIAESTHV